MDIRRKKLLRIAENELQSIEYPEDHPHRFVCLSNAIAVLRIEIQERSKRRMAREDSKPRKRRKMMKEEVEEKGDSGQA